MRVQEIPPTVLLVEIVQAESVPKEGLIVVLAAGESVEISVVARSAEPAARVSKVPHRRAAGLTLENRRVQGVEVTGCFMGL